MNILLTALALVPGKLQDVPMAPFGVSIAIHADSTKDFSMKPRSQWDTFFSIVVRNRSKQQVGIREAGFWPNHLVYLKDSKGRELPLTSYGVMLRRSTLQDYHTRDHNKLVHLNAGQELRGGQKLDLKRLYNPKPGVYTLNVEYFEQEMPSMHILSNRTTVVVR